MRLASLNLRFPATESYRDTEIIPTLLLDPTRYK